MKRYFITICSNCKEIIDSEFSSYCSICDGYYGKEVEVAIINNLLEQDKKNESILLEQDKDVEDSDHAPK